MRLPPHTVEFGFCLAAVCAVMGNLAWFKIISSVNSLDVLPYRNPLMQRMPWGMGREFFKVHKRDFPQSKWRLVARICPILLFLSFLAFVGAMFSSNS